MTQSTQRQKGMTLVELMIALLIGTGIIAGIMSAFITTNRSVMLNDALSRNQETGRFALEYITNFVRMAGYDELDQGLDIPLFITSGSLVNCNGADADACAGNDMAGIRGDRLSIPYNTSLQPINDCMGGVAGGTNPNMWAVNVFWVDTTGVLMCHVFDATTKSWIGSSVPLVSGIETMEFLLGVSTIDDDAVSEYLTVDQVDARGLVNSVRSVRISLLVNSEEEDSESVHDTNIDDRSYSVLDRRITDFYDGNLRHIFTTTINFSNTDLTSN